MLKTCTMPTLTLLLALLFLFISQASGQGSCYQRACDQVVVARDLSYSRALEVVQNEEYLGASGLVRRRRRRREVESRQVFPTGTGTGTVTGTGGTGPNTNDPTELTICAENIIGFSLVVGLLALMTVLGYEYATQQITGTLPIANTVVTSPFLLSLPPIPPPLPPIPPPSPPLSPATSPLPTLPASPPPLITSLLLTNFTMLLNESLSTNENRTNSSISSPIVATLPPIVLPPEGQAPPGLPQPGEPGGGAPPVGSTVERALALACVPEGLKAVAVFPPFARPRTKRAVAVIFSEDDEDSIAAADRDGDEIVFQQALEGTRQRSARGLFQRVARRSGLGPFFQSLKSSPLVKRVIHHFSQQQSKKPNSSAVQNEHISRQDSGNFDFIDATDFGNNNDNPDAIFAPDGTIYSKGITNYGRDKNTDQNESFNFGDNEGLRLVGAPNESKISDKEDIEVGATASGRPVVFRTGRRVVERRYGVVIKIRILVEPCELGITCDSFGNKLDGNGNILPENITTSNNGIVFYQPPDPRDVGQLDDRYFVNSNVGGEFDEFGNFNFNANLNNGNSFVGSNDNINSFTPRSKRSSWSPKSVMSGFVRRQTGESFSSSAPPDCRTEFVC